MCHMCKLCLHKPVFHSKSIIYIYLMTIKKITKRQCILFEFKLTHLTQENMDTTTFSNAFLWMKSLYFDQLDFTEVCLQGSN